MDFSQFFDIVLYVICHSILVFTIPQYQSINYFISYLKCEYSLGLLIYIKIKYIKKIDKYNIEYYFY